jgi:hypothetical protein
MKRFYLAKEWNLFHLFWKKLDYLHLEDFFPKYICELYLKQPLAPPQHKIIVAYHTSNHRLAIKLEGGQLPLSLETTNYATLVLTMKLK